MPKQLLRSTRATAKEQDRLSAVFARQLATVLREAERRIRALLDRVQEGSTSAKVQAAQALRVRSQVRAALREAGYDTLIDAATGAALDRVASRVLTTRGVAGAAAALGPEARLTLEALRMLHLQDLLEEIEVAANAVTQAITRGLLGAAPAGEIIQEVGKVLDMSERRAGTIYDTAISIYGRQVEAVQAAGDDDTPFLYSGPLDSKTRPFCLARVGKVFTRAEIDAMDNGQIPNVFLTGGGYNCRHQWVEVSKFSELLDLKGTDRRVPEVEEQLRRLTARKKKAA